MAKIKYLGSADVRSLRAGENFAGRLATPLAKDVVWSRDNHFLVDTSDAGLSPEATKLLLEDANFQDVTKEKIIPTALNERLFGSAPAEDPGEDVSGTETTVAPATDGGQQ